MSLLQHGAAIPSSAGLYEINNSVKLEPDNAEFLKRNQADGNKRTWTYSMWVKRTELEMSNGMALFYAGVYHQATRIFFDAGSEMDQLTIDLASTGTTQYRWITNRLFRDTSAWYHFVWRVDTTQSTATDRMRMYVNGVLLTADDFEQTATFPQNTDTTANDANLGGQQQMAIGNYSWANNNGIYAGYAAQCALVDGQSLAPTDFGKFDEDTGNWIPKDISGLNYGTSNNSFFLDFEDSSDLGANSKGNDANFTLNNITAVDQATDTPTNNFCVMNFVDRYVNIPTNITEGGSKVTDASAGYGGGAGTFGVTTGKWYYEARSSVSTSFLGWRAAEHETRTTNNAHEATGVVAVYLLGEYLYIFDSTSQRNDTSSVVGAHDSDHIYGIALDLDNDTIKVAKNNTYNSQGAINIDGLADQKPLLPLIVTPGVVDVNFGGVCSHRTFDSVATDANGYGKFEYAPPSGYLALCAQNLKENGG